MIELLVYALATFGLSALITVYDGPNEIFLNLRKKFTESPLTCTVCLSVFVSILLFIVVLAGLGFYLTPLAAIGIVIILERLT